MALSKIIFIYLSSLVLSLSGASNMVFKKIEVEIHSNNFPSFN